MPKDEVERNIQHYYMANPVLGKSLCSGCFFLGQEFAVRTVSVETVKSVNFCFGAKPPNSKFATKTTKKKVWKLSFFTLKLLADAKKIEISKMDEEDEHFLSTSHWKCILLSGTECHIINYLLTELARDIPRNIGPRTFSYGPSACLLYTSPSPRDA